MPCWPFLTGSGINFIVFWIYIMVTLCGMVYMYDGSGLGRDSFLLYDIESEKTKIK